MALAPKKFSDPSFPKAGVLGAGLLIPAVQGGANVAVPGHRLVNTQPFPQIWGDGDSKTGEGTNAFLWAVARLNLDVWVSGQSFGVGGSNTSNTGNNLTNATRMATIVNAIAAATAAGEIIDVVMTIGTNDVVLASMTSETIIANIRKYHNAIRAAGCRYLILMSIDPRTGLSAALAGSIAATNRAYQDYCRAIPDAFYVDTGPWLADPASSLYGPIGGAGGTFGSVTGDGLHCAAYGNLRKSYAGEQVAKSLYRPRSLDVLATGNAYDASTAVRGNILGAAGRTIALGGTANFTKNETSSVTGTPPSTFTGDGTLNGSTSLVFTAANCAELATRFGGAWPCVNVALSGTPSAASDIKLAGRIVGWAWPAGTRMRGRALVGLNNVTGLNSLYLGTQNANPTSFTYLGNNGSSAAAQELPALTGLHVIDILADPTTATNSGINLYIKTTAGRPLGGSIDLIGLEWRRADAIPAAAA